MSGLGMLGAALVAAIVSSVAGAWGLAEVFGCKHTLNERPSRQTAKFYITYSAAHIARQPPGLPARPAQPQCAYSSHPHSSASPFPSVKSDREDLFFRVKVCAQ